jgi:hypothetical protein
MGGVKHAGPSGISYSQLCEITTLGWVCDGIRLVPCNRVICHWVYKYVINGDGVVHAVTVMVCLYDCFSKTCHSSLWPELLKKRVVTHLGPRFLPLWNRKFLYIVHNIPTLNQTPLDSNTTSRRFNLILSSLQRPLFPSGVFLSDLWAKIDPHLSRPVRAVSSTCVIFLILSLLWSAASEECKNWAQSAWMDVKRTEWSSDCDRGKHIMCIRTSGIILSGGADSCCAG